jgi:hypothetical protein
VVCGEYESQKMIGKVEREPKVWILLYDILIAHFIHTVLEITEEKLDMIILPGMQYIYILIKWYQSNI